MKKLLDYGIASLLVISVALNIGLAYKVQRLEQPRAAAASVVEAGTTISTLRAETLSGEPTQIQFRASDKPTVLYVFSPTCRWCAKNLANLKTLYAREGSSYRFVGVSLSPENVPEYVAQSGFPLQSVKNPAPDAVKTLHLAGTPETIVIDSSGVVREVWPGAFRPEMCREIEAYFHLPDQTLTGV